MYERLAKIFRVDCAIGKTVKTLANMEQAVNLKEDDENNRVLEESSYFPMSVNQTSPSSQS